MTQDESLCLLHHVFGFRRAVSGGRECVEAVRICIGFVFNALCVQLVTENSAVHRQRFASMPANSVGSNTTPGSAAMWIWAAKTVSRSFMTSRLPSNFDANPRSIIIFIPTFKVSISLLAMIIIPLSARGCTANALCFSFRPDLISCAPDTQSSKSNESLIIEHFVVTS